MESTGCMQYALTLFANARYGQMNLSAGNRQNAFRLMDLGTHAVREERHSSLVLAEQNLFNDDKAAIMQNARDAQRDLDRLFEADIAVESKGEQ